MGRAPWALVAAMLVLAPPARAEPAAELDLMSANRRLQARIVELEAENAALRRRLDGSLAAALEQRAEEQVAASPDPTTGTTALATEPSRLERTGGAQSRHWVALRGARPEAGRPAEARLVIETAASGAVYRDARTLRLQVDGAAWDCPVVEYRNEPITLTRPVASVSARETVVAELPLAALDSMAGARTVQGTLGPLTFQLTPEQLATVRAFQRRLAG